MLDLDWERSIDIIPVKLEYLLKIFLNLDANINISDYKAIELGCRNSNYIVNTNIGKFVLRIAPFSDINNEVVISRLFENKINIPKLLYHCTSDDGNIFIYEFIDGVSLQKHIIDSNGCEAEYIKQVAKTAAILHNTPLGGVTDLHELDVPPFEAWYEVFLSSPNLKDRLGDELHKKLTCFIKNNASFIPEIDKYQALIHSDFRPANMLVNEKNQVYFVDWEYACTGHSLGDIGQFFRYESFFTQADKELFESEYNSYAKVKLPDNWFELARFRDLINPMQMLSYYQSSPLKDKDLIKVIGEIIS